MISHQHKCIFIHIPRTAGTSIEMFFRCGDEESKHFNARDIYQSIDQDTWDSYFKFSFIRNPWDRVVSMWSMPAFSIRNTIGKQVGHPLKYFIQHYEPFSWEHGMTIHDYLNHGEMDHIGRFEDRVNDLKIISEKIGVDINESINTKKSDHKHYTEYYDDETRDMVAEIYAKDIDAFEYEFE